MCKHWATSALKIDILNLLVNLYIDYEYEGRGNAYSQMRRIKT